MPNPEAPEKFVQAYIECALWSSVGDDNCPLDDDYGPEDIAPGTLDEMRADCAVFYQEVRATLDELTIDDSQAGHDFWLTRNGHGAGYWDRGYPEPQSTALTDAAHAWGSFDLYIGDDGQVHGA